MIPSKRLRRSSMRVDYKGRLIIIDGDTLEFADNPEDFRKVTDLIDAELFGLFK